MSINKETIESDDFDFDYKAYEKKSLKLYEKLLDEHGSNESKFQEFFEENPSFIPGAHSAFNQHPSGHNPLHSCLFTQPKLPGVSERYPDFMWLSIDSSVFSPVFIEIEAPDKKLFTQKGVPTSLFTQANYQLLEWKALLSSPTNRTMFYEMYDVDSNARQLIFEPYYILIYGRRNEFENNVEWKKKRRLLLGGQNMFLMSFDRLGPNEYDSRFPTCIMKNRKTVCKVLGPSTKLVWWESSHLANIENIEDGIKRMSFTPDHRKQFLEKNIHNFISSLKEDGSPNSINF